MLTKHLKEKKIEFVFQKCKFEIPKFSASTVKGIDFSTCNKAILFEKDICHICYICVCIYVCVHVCIKSGFFF